MMVLAAIVLGIFFWIVESFVHVYVFKEGDILGQLFSPDPNELWMRIVVVGLLLAFGGYAQRVINDRSRFELRQMQLLRNLKSANKELSDFAYVVSHDLKAPLRAVSTLANWITTDYGDRFDDKGREHMALLVSRTERMHKLIGGVLEYSRAGRDKERKERVDINNVVDVVVEMIGLPENIDIKVNGRLPVVFCEKTRMKQVFQNLINNAVKFMDKSDGYITIDCVEQGVFWRFSVADNGPGIEEKYFEKVLQPFQTLAPRDKAEGTGIGLPLVKRIVELYGGALSIESEVGQGTTFFFTLPMKMGG